MQGNPLAMIAYRIGILPLIKNIKRVIPDVAQPWYADNSGALGKFTRLETYFDSLTRQGPGRGYHPKQSKSLLIVRPENIQDGKVFGVHHGLKVCTGKRYLGGYIGGDESICGWLRERRLTWKKNIITIREAAGNIPGIVTPQW